jgi:hypothetical protein
MGSICSVQGRRAGRDVRRVGLLVLVRMFLSLLLVRIRV